VQELQTLEVRDVEEGDWYKGADPEEAEIVIYEYSDFECPGCGAMAPVLTQFLDENPNVSLVYRHFPLSFHDKAMVTAEAAEAAGAQGKFWEMHDLLFERGEWKELSAEDTRAKMSEYAEELGLDVEQFDTALDEDTYVPKIEKELAEAQSLQLPGTPSFIFNDLLFPTQQLGLSYQSLVSFVSIIELRDVQYSEIPEMIIEDDTTYQATLATSQGDITIELDPEAAPVNVNNFIFLAREGWYEETDFFFVQDNFVAVGGDPTGSGLGHPGYFCTGEVQGEFTESGLLGLLPNGQFYITLGSDANNLTGQFPLVGEVIGGAEVLDALARVQPGQGSPDTIQEITITEQ
jgi:cyclophilin family peptidyl-prolyl cis-trans isomerase